MRRIAAFLLGITWISSLSLLADEPSSARRAAASPATSAVAPSLEPEPPLPADLIAARKLTAERLAALKAPEKGVEDKAQKALRDLLLDRKRVLDALESTIRERVKSESPAAGNDIELQRESDRVKAALDRANSTPGSLVPEAFRIDPNKLNETNLAELKEAISLAQDAARDAKDALESLRVGLSSKGASAAAARSEREAITRRAVELEKLRGEVDAAQAAATGQEARDLARERRINLDWEARLDAEKLQTVDARLGSITHLDAMAALRLHLRQGQEELARRTLADMQARFRELVKRREHDLEGIARKEKDKAALTGDPLERFRARRTAELADLATSILKEERGGSDDPSFTPEEQARLAERAQEDFDGMKKLVGSGRSSGLVATRLTATFRRLASERASIDRKELSLARAYVTRYETLLTDVELDLLDNVREDRVAIESLLASLPASRAGEARALAEKFESRHQSLLNRRRSALTGLATKAEATLAQIERRLRIIDEEHAFLRTHIFWVRDAVPIGPATLSQASIEAPRLLLALGQIGDDLTNLSLWGRFSAEFLIISILIVVLPYAIYRGRLVLKQIASRSGESSTLIASCRGLGLTALIAACWPAFVALTAYAARVAPWPRPFARLMAFALGVIALDLFAVSTARTLLGRSGWCESSLRIPREVASQLRRSITILALAIPILLLPDWIIQGGLIVDGDRPVSAPVLGRSALLAFEVLAFVVIARHLRAKSPLIEWLIASSSGAGAVLARRHRIVVYLALSAFGGMIVLDAQGYAFSARKLWSGGLEAALLIGGCATLYQVLVRAIDAQAWRWLRQQGAVKTSEEEQKPIVAPDDLAPRLRRLAAWVVPIIGVLVGAWLWNLDLALFETVAAQPLWPGTEKGLNVGDLSLGLFAGLVTTIIWRHLGTFFAVVVFPRMRDDPGLHFAMLTLSRYVVLAVGGLAALSAVHLGLDQIKFVLAALGVGLGFGLQEIVSNFISGIILLIERPIRVGDIVTVAGMSGKVDKIHIRATTIINSDNQSMIVPNREFITENLINWTHKDRVVRISIPVRVAFGTDPEAVSELLLAIARDDPDVLRNPLPNALMDAFAESWLSFTLNVYVPDPSLSGRAKHRLCTEIQTRFEVAGIQMPLPAREFHIYPSSEIAENSIALSKPAFKTPVRVDLASEAPLPHFRPSIATIPAPAEDCHRGVDE